MTITKLHVSKLEKVVYFLDVEKNLVIIMQRLITVVMITVNMRLLNYLETKEMPVS